MASPEPLVQIQNDFTELFLVKITKLHKLFHSIEQMGCQSSR